MRNCRSWLYQRTVSTVSTKCLPPFYINSENIYWEPSMCQALLSNWDTSVKKPSKDPVELTFSTDRKYTLCAYIATKTHGPFTKKGTGENVCWIGLVDNVLTSSSACLSVCLSSVCLSVFGYENSMQHRVVKMIHKVKQFPYFKRFLRFSLNSFEALFNSLSFSRYLLFTSSY